MSTVRINELPPGFATFSSDARIAFEDANDESNTTKYLTITSLGSRFLPLTGGTLTGALTFENPSGSDPVLSSDSTDVDLTLDGHLLLGAGFDVKFGSVAASIAVASGFGMSVKTGGTTLDYTFLGLDDIDLISYINEDTQLGNIFRTSWFGGATTGGARSYAEHTIGVIDNIVASLEGSHLFSVASVGAQNVSILGLNIDSDKAVKIFDNLRFNNPSGDDPVLSSDSSTKELNLDGDLVLPDGGTLLFSAGGGFISAESGNRMLLAPGSRNLEVLFTGVAGLNTVLYESTEVFTGSLGLIHWESGIVGGGGASFAGQTIDISDNTAGNFSGSQTFFVASSGVENVSMLGLNLNNDNAVTIFKDLKILNQGAGGDPSLFSNSANKQRLSLNGSLALLLPVGEATPGNLEIFGEHPAPVANNTIIANFDFTDHNSNDLNRQYVRFVPMVEDDTNGSEDGGLLIQIRTAGGLATYMTFNSAGNDETAFNKNISLMGNDIFNIAFTEYTEITTPTTPAADFGKLYAKVSGGVSKPFWLDETGTEFPILNGTGTFLPLAGGTMSGDINMDGHTIEFQGSNSISAPTTNELVFTYPLNLTFRTAETFSTVSFISTAQALQSFVAFNFVAQDSNSNDTVYGGLNVQILDDTDGSEDGAWNFAVIRNGTIDIPVLGLNLNGDREVKAFGNFIFDTVGNILNVGFQDFFKIAIPANPATDFGRLYVKEINATNDGLFIKMKKENVITEVLIA